LKSIEFILSTNELDCQNEPLSELLLKSEAFLALEKAGYKTKKDVLKLVDEVKEELCD